MFPFHFSKEQSMQYLATFKSSIAAKYRLVMTGLLLLITGGLPLTALAALEKTDLTQDTSGGKNVSNVFENVDSSQQEFTTVFIGLLALTGLILFGRGLYSLYKNTKDERNNESAFGPIMAIIVGGALTGASVLVWMVRNQLIGS
jgi:hypothetical protein